jgi:hypothetical protein
MVMMSKGRELYKNPEFEYFNIEETPSGKATIDLRDDTVALVTGDRIQINQLDVFASSPYEYQVVYLDKQIILDLAEYLKNK